MTTSIEKVRALFLTAVVVLSMVAGGVSLTGIAAASASGNVSLSINAAGNQATITVDDPDLNADSNAAESIVVNVESGSEQPTAGSTQTSDTSDSSTQTVSVSPASLVADRNNDGSIDTADFSLSGASDESISGVSLNAGAYEVTISDASGSNTDSNPETVTYTKLTSQATSSDTGSSSSTTFTTDKPVADRNGDGDVTHTDVKLTFAAGDESITGFTINGNGTATITITDSGSSTTDSNPEQIAHLRREPVTLTETNQDTGSFMGTIDLVGSDSDGDLETQGGDIVRAFYWEDGNIQKSDSEALSDTSAPTISSVTLGESGGKMAISLSSDEQLGGSASDVAVTVTGPNGKSYSFDRTDFAESKSAPYTYSLVTVQAYDDGDGTYSLSVDDATDSAGNNGGNNGVGSSLTDTHSKITTLIDGTVTNTSGAAIDGATAVAVPESGGSEVIDTTDANGDYSLSVSPGTTYDVIIDNHPQHEFKVTQGVSVASGATKTVDFTLTAFPEKGFINGTILDAGGNAVSSGYTVNARELGYRFGGSTTTDATGEFSLSVPASDYLVRAQGTSGPPKTLDNVTVRAGETTDVTIQLPETGYITGTVENASGTIGGVGVVADSGDRTAFDTTNTSVQPGTGEYNITAPPGDYTVSVFAKGRDAESKQVTVTSGSESTADFTLRETSIEHTSVEVVEGSGVDTANLGIDASVLSGMLQVKLTNESSTGSQGVGGPPDELEGLGVSENTKFRMNITVTNFTASSLMWGVDDARWSTSDNATLTNGTDITVTGTPVQLQVMFGGKGGAETGVGPLMFKDPSDVSWPTGRDDQATAGRNLTVYFGVFDLSNVPGSVRNNLNGISVTTNAQRFSTPTVVNQSLRVWVAAPTKTVAGDEHNGFYQAEIPNSQLDEWGIDDPESELNALYKGDPANFTVTETDTGARIRLDNISYSAGFAEIEADPAAGNGGGGGSDAPEQTVATVAQPAASGGADGATVVTIDNVEVGDPVDVDVDDVGTDDASVDEVTASFDMGTSLDNEMSVEAREVSPASVPTYADGDVAAYLTVEIDGNLADSVNRGSFTFELTGEMMPEDPADVTVRRYHDGEWQTVRTRHLGGTQFEAVTPGYSTFAIVASGDETQADTPTLTATATPTPTFTPTATATPTATSVATATQTADRATTPTATTTAGVETGETERTGTPTGASGPGFGIAVALIGLVIVALAARRY